jgi:hypothetical protein
MAIRAAQRPDNDGLTATAHAASGGGDKVKPGVLLRIINGDASSKTLTAVTPGTAFGQAIADAAVVVANGTAVYWRVPEQGFTGDDGYVSLTWSATTSVTFEVIDV